MNEYSEMERDMLQRLHQLQADITEKQRQMGEYQQEEETLQKV